MASWPNKNNYTTGGILTATQMNEIGNAINPLGYTATKNKIINGDFRINQRNFTSTTTSGTYGHDRWKPVISGDGTCTYSTQAFTPGSAPVNGYEAINYARLVTSGQTNSAARALLQQSIEDVRTFAGQIVIVSFWAKAASGTPSIAVELGQVFGTGGSPSATVTGIVADTPKQAITTSWARYSYIISVPGLSGKTIGTDANTSQVAFNIWVSAGSDYNARTGTLGIQNNTFDIWGVQAETFGTLGEVSYSVTPQPTPFQTATGTIQGELAAASRYFTRIGGTANGYPTVAGVTTGNAQDFRFPIAFPSTMRIAPTITKNGTWEVYRVGQPSATYIGTQGFSMLVTSDATGTFYCIPNTTDDYFDCSSEL